MLHLFSSIPSTTQHCLLFSFVSSGFAVCVCTHTCVWDRKTVCLSIPKTTLAITSKPDSRHCVPLTFRKPVSDDGGKHYQHLHFSRDCSVGSALSLNTRQPIKTNASSSHGKSSGDIREPNYKEQSSGESRLWYFCHSQTIYSQNFLTELSSGGNNSAWSPHVLLPGWSPSDRWRA